VDDDVGMCDLLRVRLGRQGFDTAVFTSAEDALDFLDQNDADVVVSDLNIPGLDGIALCQALRANRPHLPVVVITAYGSLDTAVAAIRAGAYDFLTKPFEFEALLLSLERALTHRTLLEEVSRLRQAVETQTISDEIIGDSDSMKALYSLIQRIAASNASVLVLGESGTGKELIARALHRQSEHGSGPFVALNCAAMPESLLESELFGHEKGAFTDAKARRPGLLLQAHGGTLFLDEIADLPLGLQPKLLRVLEERKVRPVGGITEIAFNVRLVTATNKDLEQAAEEGLFREDLFYRINVVQIHAPPLRARGRDVLLLAQHFLHTFAQREGKHIVGLSATAANHLLAYPWPGNVRELKNCVERAVALAQFDKIVVDDLPDKIRRHRSADSLLAASVSDELVTMEEIERQYIARVLDAVGHSKTNAARILGFDRKTLYRKIVKYGLEHSLGDTTNHRQPRRL
jgi:two-component system response regulator HydG